MPAARATAHLVLRPGVHVVRRDDRHLQVGLEPPQAVVLPDDAPTRRLLERLRAGEPPVPGPVPGLVPGSEQARVLATLDALACWSTSPPATGCCGPPPTVTRPRASWPAAGPAAGERLASRAATRVAVTAPVDLRSDAVRLLRSSGLAVAAPADRSDHGAGGQRRGAAARRARRAGPGGPAPPGGRAPPPRARGRAAGGARDDGLPALRRRPSRRARPAPLGGARAVRRGDPRGRPGAARSGAAGGGGGPRGARRGLLGRRRGPASWSASLVLRPALAPGTDEWRRHPHCGCAWDELRRADSPPLAVELALHRPQVLARAGVAEVLGPAVLHGGGPGQRLGLVASWRPQKSQVLTPRP